MLEYDFDKSVGYWVVSTGHAIRRALDEELSLAGITFRQWEVLAWIALDGRPSQVQLGERMELEAPTLAGILSRMERDGWLIRTPCQQDKRCKRIEATEKAEAIWQRSVDCCHAVRARAIAGIDGKDLELFKRICSTIRSNLGGKADENNVLNMVMQRDTQELDNETLLS